MPGTGARALDHCQHPGPVLQAPPRANHAFPNPIPQNENCWFFLAGMVPIPAAMQPGEVECPAKAAKGAKQIRATAPEDVSGSAGQGEQPNTTHPEVRS